MALGKNNTCVQLNIRSNVLALKNDVSLNVYWRLITIREAMMHICSTNLTDDFRSLAADIHGNKLNSGNVYEYI